MACIFIDSCNEPVLKVFFDKICTAADHYRCDIYKGDLQHFEKKRPSEWRNSRRTET